jgi:hypothetical protein
MKYSVVNLDGRYAFRDKFKYYLGFSTVMTRQQGPIAFNDAMCWFTERYGWSAEIKQWHHINRWTGNQLSGIAVASGILAEPSSHCNPYWSWSNGYQDLRIYLASQQELAFFQLAHPVDQKKQ